MSVWSARQHALRVYLKVTHVCATLVCHEYESPYCHCQRHALHSLLDSACQCGAGVLAALLSAIGQPLLLVSRARHPWQLLVMQTCRHVHCMLQRCSLIVGHGDVQ